MLTELLNFQRLYSYMIKEPVNKEELWNRFVVVENLVQNDSDKVVQQGEPGLKGNNHQLDNILQIQILKS